MKNVQHKKHHKPKHNWYLDNVILLDSGSRIKLKFISPNLIKNIKPINSLLHVSNNKGTNKMTLKDEINKFGDVWYDPTQIASIFGLSHLVDKHRITYNNWR